MRVYTDTGLGVADFVQAEVRGRREQEALERGIEVEDGFAAWALRVPERGVPLNLDAFPFQREWYSTEIADANEVVWMKSAQVGMSSYAWRWAAWRADQHADSAIYFFPTDDDVTEFGDMRIVPSINAAPFLQRRMGGTVQNKHLKKFGSGWLALRGTQSSAAVQSVDADALVFDEYNYLHVGNLAQAERRVAGAMGAGRQSRIRRFGYPTVPGYGIDPLFRKTDQRKWHVTCPNCDEVQDVTWKDNVRWRAEEDGPELRMGHDDFSEASDDVFEAWRACRSCDASLEGDPILEGRWIATRESSRIGYHVSRLIVPRTDLITMVASSRKTSPSDQEAFWNNDLGMPFSPVETALTQDVIDAACSFGIEQSDSYLGHLPVIGGLDVASERNLSMRVSEILDDGRRRAIYIGEPSDFEEVAELMERYRIRMLVVDSLPERRMARALAATFPGRVVLATYTVGVEADAFKYDDKKNMLTIHRTEGLDSMMDSIRTQSNIPLRVPPRKYADQLMAPKRRTETDGRGRPVRTYESTGADDYAHAEVYDLAAHEMLRFQLAVEQAEQAAAGSAVAAERLGFKRDEDDYYGGFGEE